MRVGIGLDSSGRGINGILVREPKRVEGKFGGALKFLPYESVDFPPPLSEKMMLKRDFTCMAWLNPYYWSYSLNCCFSMQSGSTANEIYGIYFLEGGSNFRANTCIVGKKSIGVGEVTDATVNLNEWVHVAATYDGSILILYINGEEVSRSEVSGDLENADGKGQFAINGNYNILNGDIGLGCFATIDEVLIFNKALPSDKIKAYMEKGFKALHP